MIDHIKKLEELTDMLFVLHQKNPINCGGLHKMAKSLLFLSKKAPGWQQRMPHWAGKKVNWAIINPRRQAEKYLDAVKKAVFSDNGKK